MKIHFDITRKSPLLLITLILGCGGADGTAANILDNKDISNNSVLDNSYHSPTIATNVDSDDVLVTLKCSNFTLIRQENTVCDYWKNSKNLISPITLQEFVVYDHLNPVNELSPIEYAFFAETKMHYRNESYRARIFPNSRIQLYNDKTEINLICLKESCSKLFLWHFVTESTLNRNISADKNMLDVIDSIHIRNYHEYLKTFKEKAVNSNMMVKIFFDNSDLVELIDNVYAVRIVSKSTPLTAALNSYLQGVNTSEAQLGFVSNSLGIENFSVNVRNTTAYIHFKTDDLQITSPEQVINFTSNIATIAEQFPSVNNTEICINGIYNYQLMFFSNSDDAVVCPF